jgi:hydroxyethylthiazole kinase
MVTDGERLVRVDNGHPLLTTITGSGCMVTSLVGACLAVETDPLFAALVALVTMGLAAERAAARANGPGTFRVHLLDAVAALDGATVAAGQKVSFLS